jgi:hypothetical protein
MMPHATHVTFPGQRLPQMQRLLCVVMLVGGALGCTVQLASSDDSVIIEGALTSSGQAISGATVSSGVTSITSDATGAYSLHLPQAGTRIVVKVAAVGFAPALTVVDHRGGVFHYHADVELTAPTMMTPDGDGGMAGMTLQAGGQMFQVSIPPGTVPAGTLVQVTALAAKNGPGDMSTTEGDDQQLQTGGMIYVQATDGDGNDVPFSGGGLVVNPAMLPALAAAMGDTKAYTLDEETAVWTPQTQSTATGANLRAQQAGFWNADREVRTACVKGQLNAPQKACGGERVSAGGLDGLYSQDTAGADGTFCVNGPQAYTQGMTVGTTNRSVSFPNVSGSCGENAAACMDLGMVAVSDTDCPKSCDKTEVDDPDGCKMMPVSGAGGGSGTGGGSGGSGQVGCGPPSFGGCSALGSNYGASRLGDGCCAYATCPASCADGCGSGWYEVGSRIFGPCSDSACLQTEATAAVNACM